MGTSHTTTPAQLSTRTAESAGPQLMETALSPLARRLWLAAAVMLFVVLASLQLGLPGLHYDEAREAGVNAVELLTGAPVTAFRNTAIELFGMRFPLMVQDYIGALNVYLSLPFLALTGIGVPNLRAVAVITAVFALLFLERTVSEWVALIALYTRRPARFDGPPHASIAFAALCAVTLLAASPSFVFWSRQGIFVTNLTQPLTFFCLWQALRWFRTGRPAPLVWSALAAGLALYAKLLAGWIVLPFGLLALGWWLWAQARTALILPRISPRLVAGIVGALFIGLAPFLLFNLQTGGTVQAVADNAGQSYYGVINRNLGANALVRLGQVRQTLEGGHFWYLGGIHRNPLAGVATLLVVLLGSVRRPRLLLPPLVLAALAFGFSLFTISDLFITHFALLQPLLIAVVGLGLSALTGLSIGRVKRAGRIVAGAVLVVWLLLDLTATLRYHDSLHQSGGLADHSDAAYHLAYHLRYNGLGAPIALDWGFDAPVRYLTEGTVRPIEIFGYASPGQPDPDFGARLAPFLENPDNVYLLRAPDQTVFAGRREGFMVAVAAAGREAVLEADFRQRDGTVLYEVWRVTDP